MSREKEIRKELKTWKELPLGGIIERAGNSAEYETGSWRTWRPVFNRNECINCLTCWVLCPEEALQLRDGSTASGKPRKEIAGIDYRYCKGCGLCIRECPVNKRGKAAALVLEREEK